MTDQAPPTPAPPTPGQVASAPKRTLGTASFVLGVVSIVLSWGGLLGIASGVVGLILAKKARRAEPGAPAWLRGWGFWLSVAGLALTVIISTSQITSVIAYLVALANITGGT